MTDESTSSFTTALAVEAYKLRRSLTLLLATGAPALVAAFVFFNQLRMDRPMPWDMALKSSGGIWAFFMLPMCVTALTALVAQTEHGPRSWDHLRALPVPRWYLYAAKALCVLGVVIGMSLWLALLVAFSVHAAAWWSASATATGIPDIAGYLMLLGRIFMAAWMMIALQLWVALRQSSFVPVLALGIAGTFFAVVAPSASIGVVLPWQIPVNQLASDTSRADVALGLGCIGGAVMFMLMCWRMSRRDVS